MRINKTRYENAKKKLQQVQTELQKCRKVVEAWESSVKNCSYREEVTAIIVGDDGSVKLESETPKAVEAK